ncbi:MAG: hypothetical protein R3E39_17130 [Anaerolineae bacterium]
MNHQPSPLSALSWRPLRLCEASPWDGGSIAFAFAFSDDWCLATGDYFQPFLNTQFSELSSDDDAATMSEPTAAQPTLQRLAPSLPPANCVNSAAARWFPACQFSGNLSPVPTP